VSNARDVTITECGIEGCGSRAPSTMAFYVHLYVAGRRVRGLVALGTCKSHQHAIVAAIRDGQFGTVNGQYGAVRDDG
jgi:hypothetical protein